MKPVDQAGAKGIAMSESNNDGKPFDPLEAWREMRNVGMDAWAKAMTEAVKSEEYAKTSGAMMDAYLTASIPLREVLEKAMAQALQQMNMPTRADFTSLAERLTQVEMSLDDMDAKLEDIAKRPAEPVATKPAPTEAAPAKAKRREAKKR